MDWVLRVWQLGDGDGSERTDDTIIPRAGSRLAIERVAARHPPCSNDGEGRLAC